MASLKMLKENTTFAKTTTPPSPHIQRKLEKQAYFERQWLLQPEKYHTHSKAVEKIRIQRSISILKKNVPNLEQLKVFEIGCGTAPLGIWLHHLGSKVHLADIAQNALKRLPYDEKILLLHESLPHTKREDHAYDLVICADVIAHLDFKDFRVSLSELNRVLEPEGKLLISTPLDIDSVDALERFMALVETEFVIDHLLLSYHSFFIRLLKWIKKVPFSKHICSLMERSVLLNKALEYIAKFLWNRDAVSHAIILAHKKPLF
ncbi:MAG: hypothetical protein Tsb0021_06640 [Chlamydiales bacterium]